MNPPFPQPRVDRSLSPESTVPSAQGPPFPQLRKVDTHLKLRIFKLRILTSDFVCGMRHAACGMRHAVCGMRYAAKNRTYGIIVWTRFLTADFRFATARGMRCEKMNRDMSRFMRHAEANSDGEIQKLTSQVGVFMNFDDTRDSQQVRPDVRSAYTLHSTHSLVFPPFQKVMDPPAALSLFQFLPAY